MGEGDAARVFLQQRLYVGGEEDGMGDEELAVFLLPFVAVGLNISIVKVGLQMGRFVEKDPEEEVGIEVSVDADFVEIVVGIRMTIITEFRPPFEGDVEMDLVEVEVVVYPTHRRGWQMV